ncbi:hypothetical protein [Propionivibrio soli]|uniref:hypothetical protein n=1 Tax=Propionivibrio soli TaxID=2976531 RepID=UPI0021E96B09|nr:hypothetical protein [Propionivibrio soli]
MSTPITMGGVSAAQLQNMDLETAMMMIQSDRASNLEVQLKDQLKGVADRNKEIANLNKLLTDLRSRRPSGNDTDKWNDLGGTKAEGQALYARIKEAGLTMPTGGDVVDESGGNGIYDAKQKTFDVWAEEIKGKIDALSSSQQMDMLRLQSLSNKRNEAFEIMTNFVKKMSDNRASIVGNMR